MKIKICYIATAALLLSSSCRTEAQTAANARPRPHARAGDEYRSVPAWVSLNSQAAQQSAQLKRMHDQTQALMGVIAAKYQLKQSTSGEQHSLNTLRKNIDRVQKSYEATGARIRLLESQIKLSRASGPQRTK